MRDSSRFIRSVAVVSALTAITAACAGNVSTVESSFRSYSDYVLYRSAAADGTIHVAVAGGAQAMEPDRLRNIVVEQFGMVQEGPVTTYTTDPAAIDNRDLRFVVAFNPGPDLGTNNICKDDAALPELVLDPAAAEGGLTALAAFCDGRSVRTWSKSRAGGGQSGDTVIIEALTRQIARSVIPDADRDKRSCDPDPC